jgi:uncharacterized BrkB/YihY/UPF0761 family membrane protein
VLVGAIGTALLFTVGKSLIGLYLGSSSIASSYGAAGGLIIALLWVYYSAQIFLLGAEFTKAYAYHHGTAHSGKGRRRFSAPHINRSSFGAHGHQSRLGAVTVKTLINYVPNVIPSLR